MNTFSAKLIDHRGSVFEGTVWRITIRGPHGLLSLMAHHENIITSLASGPIKLATTPDVEQSYRTTGGFLEFSNNQCIIICDSVEKEQRD